MICRVVQIAERLVPENRATRKPMTQKTLVTLELEAGASETQELVFEPDETADLVVGARYEMAFSLRRVDE